MTDFILKLLGGNAQDAVNISGVDFGFRPPAGVPWIFALLGLLCAAAIYYYSKSPVKLSPARLLTLGTLRILLLLTLGLLLLRPVLALIVEGKVRRSLALLVDTSTSMQIKDPRAAKEDINRLATVSDNQTPLSRVAMVQAAFTNSQLSLVRRLQKDFDVDAFYFGGTASTGTRLRDQDSAAWFGALSPTNIATGIGEALRSVLRQKRGQSVAGVVVVTDGASNSGPKPHEIIPELKSEQIPVYAYGVGTTHPPDAAITQLFAPEAAFVDDELVVPVQIRSAGIKGESSQVTLKLGTTIVASQPVVFTNGVDQVVELRFTPMRPGSFDLKAAVAPFGNEAITNNNVRSQRVRVTDSKVKVLLAEQAPRWEFRYLQAMLLRDRRIQLHCWLAEADPAVSRVENSPYISQFPASREALSKYDVIIFGDINPKSISPDRLNHLNQWVSDFGGAFIMLAGRNFSPVAYRGTALQKLLPVDVDLPGMASADSGFGKPIQLQATARGESSPGLRLSKSEEENRRLWRELPPVHWVARVSRAKPAAEVWLVDPDPTRESRSGKMPVVALHQYGLGEVLYVGTDNTWRWRKNVGDLYYTAFWSQNIQRMGMRRLMGGSKRSQITADRQNYVIGDRVSAFARLYTPGFEPLNEETVTGSVVGTNGGGAMTWRRIPEQPAFYRGDFVPTLPGLYRLTLDHDPDARFEFAVAEAQFEYGETALNEVSLRQLADATGGAFFREETLYSLPDAISKRTRPVQSSVDVELWSAPLPYIVILLLVGSEWYLRKRWHLK